MLSLSAYPALFISAFGAATLLPLQSEAVLVALLLAGQHPLWALLLVATLGNVLGSWINWLLGRSIEHYRERRWFPVSPARLQQAQDWYARYGRWSLLLSWMPVIGDPLTLVAGVMRERLWIFVAIVTLAKAGRYAALAAITLAWV
ncbi:DedA family protein [Pseudomonas sp. LMG 31766]|jgi:membrane protein YqaA with SNARE-associated domain|uniref:DedA family protein n=1 Tax=Pseudomonas chaetocerotis TaxID=2758695 RepID=A0A931CYM6_9PSED|nr:YqaA family protein [Pseudomonas chaetocerotis]MBZ9663547.1 DedA family protein [Pseudomonas chaetocerotis]